jgi:hypothetical protein
MDDGYCQTFWDGELHEQDAALYRDLARDTTPAAALREATADRPLRSPRYRRFVQPQGYDDELRVVFRSGESTWGGGRPVPREGPPALQRRGGGAHGEPLRGGGCRVPDAGGHAEGNSGARQRTRPVDVLLERPDLGQRRGDEVARRHLRAGPGRAETWREVLPDGSSSDLRSAIPILPLLARARAAGAGFDEGPARLRVRDQMGRWLLFHASSLIGGAADGTVAVVVEPAKSADIAPIIIEAYALSPRERDVVRAIARGCPRPRSRPSCSSRRTRCGTTSSRSSRGSG